MTDKKRKPTEKEKAQERGKRAVTEGKVAPPPDVPHNQREGWWDANNEYYIQPDDPNPA